MFPAILGAIGSALGSIGGFAGSAAGAGLGAVGSIAGSIIGRNDQVNANDYQKALNASTMAREDNAIQRRVADLNAAGLSPTLAAGSSASSASFRSGETPTSNVGRGVYEGAMAANALKAQQAQVGMTEAQTRLINAQVPGADAVSAMNIHDARLAGANPHVSSRSSDLFSGISRSISSVGKKFDISKGPGNIPWKSIFKKN